MKYFHDEDHEIKVRYTLNGPIDFFVKEKPELGWRITALQEHPGEDPLESVNEWLCD